MSVVFLASLVESKHLTIQSSIPYYNHRRVLTDPARRLRLHCRQRDTLNSQKNPSEPRRSKYKLYPVPEGSDSRDAEELHPTDTGEHRAIHTAEWYS